MCFVFVFYFVLCLGVYMVEIVSYMLEMEQFRMFYICCVACSGKSKICQKKTPRFPTATNGLRRLTGHSIQTASNGLFAQNIIHVSLFISWKPLEIKRRLRWKSLEAVDQYTNGLTNDFQRIFQRPPTAPGRWKPLFLL